MMKEVVVVDKLPFFKKKDLEEFSNPNIDYIDVFNNEQVLYSLSPDYIYQSINRSLSALKLSTIDLYMIQSPEFFLTDDVSHCI